MKRILYEIASNVALTADVFRMDLRGDTSEIVRPGQFINIALEGRFLRRPISVCDWDEDGLTIIYKVVGGGTAQMAGMRPGEKLDALTGLGNGYDVAACPQTPLLVGGGVGVPPLYGLARRLIAAGKYPSVILGFNRQSEIFLVKDFAALDIPVIITTVDGSVGIPGFVTDAMQGEPYVCCCGPEPMLRAVYGRSSGGQFSFEARMGCGFGACMGCSCKTKYGTLRICKDGPVLQKEAIIW